MKTAIIAITLYTVLVLAVADIVRDSWQRFTYWRTRRNPAHVRRRLLLDTSAFGPKSRFGSGPSLPGIQAKRS